MTARGLTRGPLPPSVYWRRRAAVLLVAAVLVFGVGQLLTLGSDGSGGAPGAGAAELAGSGTTSAPADPGPTAPVMSTGAGTGTGSGTGGEGSARSGSKGAKGTGGKHGREQQLAVPVGTCSDEDVSVTPVVKDAVAGRDVTLTLKLRTLENPACTWSVSPRHLTLKITSGSDTIWSTLQCPRAIAPQDVVVRSAVATPVQLTWMGRRSDADCSRVTDWALPGYYHLQAAALGGEPGDVQFHLQRPVAPVITRTAEPTQQPTPAKHR